ncbi:HAD family hydrolase [Georgenia alba]|uniref:HAD family hydrolase n=1 Tax=Georgenia alba TaxID=2233858 RepID=A0ABW2QBH5_9MICO
MNDRTLPEAVLWDMDGTLVSTEPYWMAAEIALAARHGASWSEEQALELVGKDLVAGAAIYQARTGIGGAPEDVAAELQAAVMERAAVSGAPWRPGVLELLARLRDAHVPCAVVTMSWTSFAHAVAGAAPPGTFATVVAGDEVTHGKPHPEPYLTAAERLGVDVTRCVAFEDSLPGVASAMASGARTIAVPLAVDVPAQPGLSRVGSVEDVDLDTLARVVAGEDLDALSHVGTG